MKLSNLWTILLTAYLINRSFSQKDLDEFKLAVFKKIYLILPQFLNVQKEIEILFDATNIKGDLSENEQNMRLKRLLDKINKSKIEELDESLRKELKD